MKHIPLASIVIGDRRPIDPGKVRSLSESIAERGLINPITVRRGRILVCGLHRLSACQLLGWTDIPAIDLGDLGDLEAELAEIDENLFRNELTALERGEHLLRRDEILEALGIRAKAGQNQHTRGGETDSPPPKTTAAIAKEMGISERVAQQEKQIARSIAPDVKAAIKDTPVADSKTALLELARLPKEEQREIVAKGEKEILSAAKAIRERRLETRRRDRIKKLVEISKGNTELTGDIGLFPVLYADPPWRYEHAETESRAIENQYPTMELDAICALRVPEICTPDAVLFLWATSPKLAEAMRVIEAWGFSYRTCMVWVKDKIGMGYYARQRHELLLIAVRGTPPTPPPSARCDSVIEAPRGKHSAKPDEFRAAIERMYPNLPKVELFCRKAAPGWKVWGNQA